MATTNATITINSDITSSPLSISKNMVLKKFQSTDGIDETTGLQTKKFAATTAVAIIINTEGTAAKASKVYIRNTGSDSAEFFYVALNNNAAASDTTETIGKLYAGDWMFIPWCAASGKDIEFTVSDATETTLEYTCFYE
jgi:hypothetical protein